MAKVDATGKVTGVTPGTAKVTVTTEDGAHTDNIIVTVKEPAALTTLKGSMKRKTKTVDGVEDILYSIICKLENTSTNNIVLSKVTLFCDGKALTNDTPDPAAELLAKVGSYESQFDIDIEYEEVEVEVEKEKETTDETKTDDTKAENGSSDSSSNGTRYGVRRSRTRADGEEGGSGSGSEAGDGDSESGSDSGSEGEAGDGDDKEGEGEKPATEKVKRPKVNTHTYVVVWTYTYAGKEFTFQYPQTVQTTTSRAGVRRARSRR